MLRTCAPANSPASLTNCWIQSHARCAFSTGVSFGARGWSSGSSGLIKSRTGATPFQSLMQLAFQESRSLISSSRWLLVFTLSTVNQAGSQCAHKTRNVEQSKKRVTRFLPVNSRLLLLNFSPTRRPASSAPARSWSSFSFSCRRRATSSSKSAGAISGQ
jgi:hypothetical protein